MDWRINVLIVLNHKMNLNIEEITAYEKTLRDYDVVVMPQTPYMGLFSKGKYILGSQCISEYNAPGGVSADALVGLNVKYVIVGHAERRMLRNECDDIIAKKINTIIEHEMIPILCVGEQLPEKEAGLTNLIIEKQISEVFSKIKEYNKVLIAYEPVWSIGTNNPPAKTEIEKTLTFIKNYLKETYLLETDLLYGGSVNSNNIKELKEIEDIKGVIIGSAALDIDEVINIYNIVNG